MIELKELTLGYGQRTLLEMVNARMTGGQLIALLGRNGAGKSTLLRAMMGLEKPQSGEIILQGKKIASLKPEKLARSISFVTTDRCSVYGARPLYKLDRTTTTGRRNAGRYCHTAGRYVRLCGKNHG